MVRFWRDGEAAKPLPAEASNSGFVPYFPPALLPYHLIFTPRPAFGQVVESML
jgi:hypothetical protein